MGPEVVAATSLFIVQAVYLMFIGASFSAGVAITYLILRKILGGGKGGSD